MILLTHLPQETQILHLLGYQDFVRIQSSGIYFFNLSNQNVFFPNYPANKAYPGRIHRIFIHFEISRLPGGLAHLADTNSISWNPATNCHPIQIALIRLMSLLLLDVQLILQFRLFLSDKA